MMKNTMSKGAMDPESLRFLSHVKKKLSKAKLDKDEAEADYAAFLRIIKLRKADSITPKSYKEKLQYVLRKHPEAVNAVNNFLHPDWHIEYKPPSYYEGHLVGCAALAKSIDAVNYIKKQCGKDVEKYKRFLKVMEGYDGNNEIKNVERIYEQIYDLFEGNAHVANKVGCLFGLATPTYVFLPEKNKEKIVEFEDLGVDLYTMYPANLPLIQFKLSDVLNNKYRLCPRFNYR